MATLCRPRKKAFLGAAISAGTSIIGSLVGGIQAKKKQREEEKLLEAERIDLENQNKTINLAQSEVAADARRKLYETKSIYADGGKQKIDNNVQITDGGYAKPIAKDTYKLVGRKHDTGGIGIKTKADQIEAESGEVIVKDGNDLKILSDRLVDNKGKTPSDNVMTNPSKDKAKREFTKQEQMKDGGDIYIKPSKRGTFTKAAKERGYGVQEFADKVLSNKDNYSTAMVKKANFARNSTKWDKAALGDKRKINPTDAIAQGIGLAAPLISGVLGMTSANKMKAPSKPRLMTPTRMVTDVNTGAIKSEVEQDYQDLDRAIEANTASSATSLARRQRNLNTKTKQFRSIDEAARNRESELINRDLANKQAIEAANLDKLNRYDRESADFQNRQVAARTGAINQMLGAGRDAVLDIQNRADLDRYNQERLDIAKSLSTRPTPKEQVVNPYDFSRIDTNLLAKRRKPVVLPTTVMACGGKAKMKRKK